MSKVSKRKFIQTEKLYIEFIGGQKIHNPYIWFGEPDGVGQCYLATNDKRTLKKLRRFCDQVLSWKAK